MNRINLGAEAGRRTRGETLAQAGSEQQVRSGGICKWDWRGQQSLLSRDFGLRPQGNPTPEGSEMCSGKKNMKAVIEPIRDEKPEARRSRGHQDVVYVSVVEGTTGMGGWAGRGSRSWVWGWGEGWGCSLFG